MPSTYVKVRKLSCTPNRKEYKRISVSPNITLQNLLRDEPKTYMAYLLLGAAYQNSNKAEAAKHLRKAVEYCAPSAPTVALQGLANCAPLEELPKIYEQLLELVPDKYADYYEKLSIIAEKPMVAAECCNFFKRESMKSDKAHQELANKYLVKIWLENDFKVNEDDELLFKTALETVIADASIEVHLNAYKRYLKLLYKQNDLRNCTKHACLMVQLYPNDIYAYEWICKIYCENYNNCSNEEWGTELQMPIQEYANMLLKLNDHSHLGLLIKAIDLFAQRQFVAARELLYKVQTIQDNYPTALQLLACTEMALGAYGLAVPLWQKLGKVQEESYAICLSHTEEKDQLQEAVVILLKMEQTEEITNTLARCYFKLGELKELHALQLNVLAKAEFTMLPKEALELLKTSADLETFDTLLLLGKIHLEMCDYAAALNCLLKATRLQPHRSECFFHLGQVYYANSDVVRARKCFEKCISLNPLFAETVNNLSAIYQQLNEEELNVTLLLNTLKHMKSESSKHVHFKLGLHYLDVLKCDDAIQSFRTAIKLDVTCMIYWESLGDAYCERGSYHSAERVFQKILEMDATNLYAKLKIALIKTTIRMYPEAIEDFKSLLQDHPDYLLGLKGAAEAHIGLANNLKLEHRYGRCKLHLQLATNHLQRAFLSLKTHDMVWLWRLAANVFLQTAQMPTSMANLEVSGKMAKRDTETAFLTRQDLFSLATRFYTCALKLKQNTYLWYELALCCYYSAVWLPEEAQTHLDLAVNACKTAIQQQGNRWQNWNLLGVIHMHKLIDNLPLAQHCFVQALTLERKSYVTWTNLGVLYLKLSDIKLANQAFQRAQQSSPIYPNAWIGQAMIAEAINEEEEALDLFRHCQQFEYHAETALGYAHWVCEILSDGLKCSQPHYKHAIDNMFADVVALDAINWYMVSEEQSASVSALSFQGFLNARQKLYRPAVQAYLQAVKQATAGAERDKMCTSLGYLYLQLNQPEEAIDAFNMVTQATFTPIIGLALAYYRAGQHQESYSVYNSVLKSVADSEDDKAARILVAMAAMVYASQGEADTKTILYQCILLKNSPIQALYSACALGILHQDNQLTETILIELKKYENVEEYCAHIAYLTAQHYLANQQPGKALSYLMSRVHIFPQCAELRKVMANFMLHNFGNMPQYQLSISQMALSAIILTHSNKRQRSDCIEDAKSLLIASRALQQLDKPRSLKLIQRAIRLHPQNAQAWRALQEAH